MSASNDLAGFPTGRLAVLVGLDFTDADGPAFDQAARIAHRLPGSELHLVHVFGSTPSPETAQDLAGHLRLYVDEKAAMHHGLGGVVVGIHLRGGKPVREIVQLATELDAAIIVVGSHRGPHLKQWLLGSTADRLLRGAPCPVVVASPPPREPERHEPAIEPPCPECVEARFASRGQQWWCARHSHAANAGHAFSYQRELPFALHDSEAIPTGTDF
ncbi:MAG: universal stress protein [Polyangiaceae bacterium]